MNRIIKSLLIAVPLALAGAMFASMWPELKRYQNMREM